MATGDKHLSMMSAGRSLRLTTEGGSCDVDCTPEQVVHRIEEIAKTIVKALDDEMMPMLSNKYAIGEKQTALTKTFAMNQCRSFTSILLVFSFCHSLLYSRRTTTTREVYYHYVTHFRSQQECDLAIRDAAALLCVPRHALGLRASPRGWFCGDVQIIHADGSVLDGRALPSGGAPVSSVWLQRDFTIGTTSAVCILVIEKEGVYNRLSEDRFFDDHPCILVTGRGFPDLATRAMVHALHHNLRLPVWGLADCNPYGVMVLNTYQHSGRRGVDGGDRYSVPIQWLGLRPSQVQVLESKLPYAVYQEISEKDSKRLAGLVDERHRWTHYGQNERRLDELDRMREFKVELEALNWLGIEYCAKWLGEIFHYQRNKQDGADLRDEEREII